MIELGFFFCQIVCFQFLKMTLCSHAILKFPWNISSMHSRIDLNMLKIFSYHCPVLLRIYILIVCVLCVFGLQAF